LNKPDMDGTYLAMARAMSLHSKGKRAKVGAVLVTKHGVVLTGYNGTPPGWSNELETQVDYNAETKEPTLVTKPEVIHAELNCILKAAREGVSVIGSSIFTTLAPCVPCSAMIASAGVSRVIYDEEYRDMRGVELLRANGLYCCNYKHTRW
jgi:dCMP deaminase